VAIKRGEAGAGLLQALQEIGGILARHFPPRKDDVDELPDAVVRV
jgi:putative membrane protein